MASVNARVQELIDSVQAFNDQASLLLAAVGQGELDPAQMQARIEAVTREAIDAVLAQLEGYDATVIARRQEMFQLAFDKLVEMGEERMFFELFAEPFSFADVVEVGGVSTVAGDESVDCADTSSLAVGREYALVAGSERMLVTVSAILSPTRFRATQDIPASYSGAVLRRTTASLNGQSTVFAPGQVYYGGPFHLGVGSAPKSLVVRHRSGEALKIHFKTSESGWSVAEWKWHRELENGDVDVEYRLPAQSGFELKATNESSTPVHARYIVGIGSASGLGGEPRPPERPSNMFPEGFAEGVQETPTLQGSSYSSAVASSQGGLQAQISAEEDFSSALVHDSGLLPAGESYSVPEGVLLESSTYYWRLRYRDDQGAWSEWSAPTAFTTDESFVYLATPSVLNPATGATDVPARPTLTSTSFVVSGGEDEQDAVQWQIRSASGSYASPVYDSGALTDSEEFSGHVVPQGILRDGNAQYFARVRVRGAALGWSAWSNEAGFVTKTIFANIVGIALMVSGGGAGTWQRVDKDGNALSTDAAFFNHHPVYAGIQEVEIDGQALIRIPKFWIRTATGPAGSTAAGKKVWWISDQDPGAGSGFYVHPAFMSGGQEIDQYYVGKYECGLETYTAWQANTDVSAGAHVRPGTANGYWYAAINDGTTGANQPAWSTTVGTTVTDGTVTWICAGSTTMAGSQAGVAPIVSIDFPTMASRIEARNQPARGSAGWHMWTIYELSAIQRLLLIENGGPDVQSTIGSGNISSSAAQNTGVTNATWRSIRELWGNVWHMVDGLRGDASKKAQLFDRLGNRNYVDTNWTVPIYQGGGDGWITAMKDGANSLYDFDEIFVAGAVDGIESNGTYGDHHWGSITNFVTYHGGGWNYGSLAGLFSLSLGGVASGLSTAFGSRLAKV